jgi:hypothetical protein
MLQGHVSSKDAHEMMMLMVMPCHDHAQMMLTCKANTWGVTTLPLIKISSQDLENVPFFIKGGVNFSQIMFPFLRCISLTMVTPHDLV